MSSKIPLLLEPYLTLPPEASLILLTSVLGASINWLVLRFLYSALINTDGSGDITSDGETRVVLVSFMRDFAFWKENSRRLGLDLEKLAAKKRFSFVDGLSGLFTLKQQKAPLGNLAEKVIENPGLSVVFDLILNAVHGLKTTGAGGKVILVIDQLDLLLAATGPEVGIVNLSAMLMHLREHIHSITLTLSADSPLVTAQETPLETDHSAFLLSTAHQADFIMGLRLLDSGTARDVSGVIRITVGDHASEDEDFRKRIEERELLYFVGGDGGVKVFERGQ